MFLVDSDKQHANKSTGTGSMLINAPEQVEISGTKDKGSPQ